MGGGGGCGYPGVIGWDVRPYAWLATLSLSGVAVLPILHAADKPVDPGLLEFLGSVDSDDKDWHDYLARTDIDKVARRGGNVPAGAGAPPAASPPRPANTSPPPSSAAPVTHP